MPWHQGLSVGIELIDEQHQEWFKKAEALFDAGKKGQAKEYVGELLQFLDSYTKKHFKDEEDFMASIGYPELAEQKTAHAAFVRQLEKVRRDYETSGGNLKVIIEANLLVIDWLTKHISNMDRKIGEYTRREK